MKHFALALLLATVVTEARGEKPLLPQQFDYQVELYRWLKSLKVTDVTIPRAELRWNRDLADVDALADFWLEIEGVTASSVVRGEPEWYVLDAGGGKGIEATGKVRVWHDPKGADYGGNPARSWSNEPAWLYQLKAPLADGSQGNPYYRLPALGRRAMVVAAVDMLMYHQAMLDGGFATWQDMYGKALLGWSEAYRWCKGELDPKAQKAFEIGFGHFLDQMIAVGPRSVNTNMDMFAVQAAAEIYMSTADPKLRDKAFQAVKRSFFGYPDGELSKKHKVFPRGKDKGGVFDTAGFIMEGGQPDVFYGGESIYHLAGALAAVMDRETGTIPAEWQFLEEVLRRCQEWRTYQNFYDPGVAPTAERASPAIYLTAGAGMSGRTGAGVPNGQAGHPWKFALLADHFPNARHVYPHGVPDAERMRERIERTLKTVNAQLVTTYEGPPPTWAGWSPWTKKTPFLPARGWYSRLKKLADAHDPALLPPVARRGVYYNKSFGGPPVGDEYWAYKSGTKEREWGFFVEAQARQGGYGGWYGGKVETFWTSATGVVILNRHGKTGADPDDKEDSVSWHNLEWKAGHHVWGRDEHGKGFTTLLLRGRELKRTSTFDLAAETPRVEVINFFNDPSHADKPAQGETGEQTGAELAGQVQVTNTFEALPHGLRITHAFASDEQDELRELWASIPVYLRAYAPNKPGDQMQRGLEDTTIEYLHGDRWQPLPEDAAGDGVPEIVTTHALRLGRDFKLGAGPQYAYVNFDGPQRLRLATQIYTDPYQTLSRLRTVHIDLHGAPGTAKTLKQSFVRYTLSIEPPPAATED